MGYLLYLMFRCDFDVMESLDVGGGFVGSKHTPGQELTAFFGGCKRPDVSIGKYLHSGLTNRSY